ncbi:OmpA family protein [Sinomicrobium weinanense]|uniref:OmpA family protein n=1 Tax=Sinomicrobium weinanense TaxID=2842200 RepID=A0A926Q1V0_9FLAO|nr:OmpA family protein [Sinomicrobium weinanense]MBC9796042.1 OmpA family protein [Sinomicrobium weinanense]MBU3123139.1 OmpA family protein [Sinomicrobium weinanense]
MRKLLLLLSFLGITIAYGQQRSTADRYFEKLAYVKSAALYRNMVKKGDSSMHVLSRLGDSYYYNTDMKEAENWYGILISKYEQEVEPDYLFRYAQALKGNQKYDEAVKWMKVSAERGGSDPEILKLLEEGDYYTRLTNPRAKLFGHVHNLAINTEYSDFGGFILDDRFYFASTRPSAGRNKIYDWNKQPFLNIYTGHRIGNEVDEVKKLDGKVNTKYHEATLAITSDGKTMYFTRDNADNGKKSEEDEEGTVHLQLYKATLDDAGKWDNITALPFNDVSYSVGHPALSPDEKKLYFVSDMPGGYGVTDIYVVDIYDDGSYGTPQNLGNTINTRGREMFPFMDKNGVLYFSSNGHPGLGGLDIVKSELRNGQFGNVTNPGVPINSALDDFAFMINEDNTEGYLSSNRLGGQGDDDIYHFTARDCNVIISGKVTDIRTEEPLVEASVRLIEPGGGVVAHVLTDVDGMYKLTGDCLDASYTVVAEMEDYRSNQKEVDVKGKEEAKVNLPLTPLIIEDEIVIKPIYFDYDKWDIRSDAEYELEHIVSVMNAHPEMIIKIESHTDSRGNDAYNEKLSDHRAKATRDYLYSRGIAKDRIESAIGYGEKKLLNHCANGVDCTEEEHQLNRRSAFIIVNKE